MFTTLGHAIITARWVRFLEASTYPSMIVLYDLAVLDLLFKLGLSCMLAHCRALH